MTRHYCTLFDRTYFARGVAMLRSLAAHSTDPVRVHVLALDDETAEGLHRLNLPIEIIPLATLEAALPLAPVRASRTWAEYCWTLASNLASWLHADEITYLDADLFFFSDPRVIFDEIGDRAIGIIPHRFIPPKRYLVVNGVFNVGWVTFRGPVGQQCVDQWAAECRAWCFNRAEAGRFGDQKYLDAWPARYGRDCAVILNPGAGLAPWNLANYAITAGPQVEGLPVVFFHFHEFAEREGMLRYSNYVLRHEDIEHIYRPYVAEYYAAKNTLESLYI